MASIISNMISRLFYQRATTAQLETWLRAPRDRKEAQIIREELRERGEERKRDTGTMGLFEVRGNAQPTRLPLQGKHAADTAAATTGA